MIVKQIISIIMLSLVISHGVYELFIFKVFQIKYREEVSKEIESGITDEELVLFSFSLKDYKSNRINVEWIEEDEFRFNKEMYDVVEEEVKGDSIYLYCFHDKKESVLYLVMEKIINSSGEKDYNKLTYLYNYFSQFYSIDHCENSNFRNCKPGIYSLIVPSDLLKGEYFLITPPPRS